jgi:hypothetical protein
MSFGWIGAGRDCSHDKARYRPTGLSLKALSDHFLALFPQRFSVVGVKRTATHAFADCTDRRVVGHDPADVAVLAVAPADRICWCSHARPDGGCGPLEIVLNANRGCPSAASCSLI